MSRFWRHFRTDGHCRLVEDHLGVFGKRMACEGLSGFRIRLVRAGSPAAAAGLQRGDVLLSIDGIPVRSLRGLERRLLDLPTELPLALAFQRGQRIFERCLILEPHPAPSNQSMAD